MKILIGIACIIIGILAGSAAYLVREDDHAGKFVMGFIAVAAIGIGIWHFFL